MKEFKNSQEAPQKEQKKENFFQILFESIFKSSSPEVERRRKLKNLAKTISKSKFHSFYRPSSLEILAPFGKFIFDLYKIIAPAQLLFKNTQNPAIFNRQIINYLLSERQINIIEKLDERKILEISKQVPIQKLTQQVEQMLQIFINDFDGERATRAANLSRAFTLFKDFCTFDYYLIIRKFDSTYQEFSFNSVPRLEKINAEYIVDDLKDFVTVAYAITDTNIDWTDLFTMFKKTHGKDIISIGTWKKIIARLRTIQSSHIFDLIIKHISQDLKYETQINTQIPSIIEPYMDKFENETRELIEKIQNDQKESKANSICMQIFGTTDPQNMKNYVPSFNAALDKKDLDLIEYAEPLNYLKTFLIEFVKTDIREYYEVIVIRGQWDATLSAPMSNAYQDLLKTSDLITTFDEEFADEGAFGIKIKTLLPKTAHDAGAGNIINRVVSDTNDTARGYIIQSTQNLITIGKTIKQLLEDYMLPKPTIVQNWRELEKYIEEPMKDFCVNIYKKIYLFVQLMQTFI